LFCSSDRLRFPLPAPAERTIALSAAHCGEYRRAAGAIEARGKRLPA